ncbi:MAG: hypothetical protein M5U09_12105 [Gammaproteobacteria bacterium]|nr:hypothetical protein [Gammaproteobacteria bacterium]
MVARYMGRYVLQGINYAVFMALVGYFSAAPDYRRMADDAAVVTVAFGHTTERVSECVERSAAELETLAPNMRAAPDCPRERSPLSLELMLDGETVADMYLKAPGLYDDQGVDVYRDVVTVAGSHRLTVRMNDDVNADGPTYVLDTTVNPEPQRRAVVSFEPGRGFAIR